MPAGATSGILARKEPTVPALHAPVRGMKAARAFIEAVAADPVLQEKLAGSLKTVSGDSEESLPFLLAQAQEEGYEFDADEYQTAAMEAINARYLARLNNDGPFMCSTRCCPDSSKGTHCSYPTRRRF